MQNTGIYFLRAEGQGFVKIGYSVDVERRVAALRCGSPYELTVIGVLAGFDEDEEAALHKRFAHLRTRGEWFAEEGELAEFIKSLRSEEGYEEGNERSMDIETERHEINQLRAQIEELKAERKLRKLEEANRQLEEENQSLKEDLLGILSLLILGLLKHVIEELHSATQRKQAIAFPRRGRGLSGAIVEHMQQLAKEKGNGS